MDLEENEEQVKRRPLEVVTSRGRFVRVGSKIGAVLLLVILSAWYWFSPYLSQATALMVSAIDHRVAIRLFLDPAEFGKRLAADLDPLFQEDSIRGQLQSAGISPVMLHAIIETATPLVIASAVSPAEQKLTDAGASQMLLPMLLQVFDVNKVKWEELLLDLRGYSARMGQCKIAGSKAACEVDFQGKSGSRYQLAILWERQNFRWKIDGVSGLSDVVRKMRPTK